MMNFYKSRQWKSKREVILKRDEYLCRECKRYGKTTPAATVNHIMPLELYFEYRLMNWNLLSLCNKCERGSDTGLSVYCPRLKCVK